MTPQEAVIAYEAYCVANKSYKISWKEGATMKNFTCLMPVTMGTKVAEILPLCDQVTTISIVFVDSVPTWEGYVEWLSFQ